jgi:protein-L-isoaspartate(D-aspartate) O-methyltransferase
MTVLSEPALDASAARRAMIDSQLRPSGVNDARVLAAFAKVSREDFVPPAAASVAYMDRGVPLGEGRFLAPPISHGQMLVEAKPTGADRALVVDGGSGYLAALLGPLVGTVETIAPGEKPRGKDYSLLLIDGAIEELPATLTAVLADDGRVLAGLIERGVSRLAIGRKAAGAVGFLTLGEADFAPLAAYARPRQWSF